MIFQLGFFTCKVAVSKLLFAVGAEGAEIDPATISEVIGWGNLPMGYLFPIAIYKRV